MDKPDIGNYQFVQPYSLVHCAEYSPGDFPVCTNEETISFASGDVIYSDRAFFNSETNSWDIGIQIYTQNRSIPQQYLELVSKEVPVNRTFQVIPDEPYVELPTPDEPNPIATASSNQRTTTNTTNRTVSTETPSTTTDVVANSAAPTSSQPVISTPILWIVLGIVTIILVWMIFRLRK